MRRGFVIGLVLLLALAGVAIGVTAYHAGLNHGLDQAASGARVVHVVGPGYDGFPFGLFLLVGMGRRVPPGPDHRRVGKVMIPNEPGDLLHRHPRAGRGEAPGRHVPHVHLGL